MLLEFKGVTADELFNEFSRFGLVPGAARKLQCAVFRKGVLPRSLPEVSYRVIERVREHTKIPHLSMTDKVVSQKDGFARYVFRGTDECEFEAVRIPLMHRPCDPKYIVCVSSQVGCAMGCAFCFTGKMGFRRNLETWEIVDQVIKIRDDSEHPVRGVVFMGMGEPMLNYDAVMHAARIICEPCGLAISAKAITISTAGIVPAIRSFISERVQYRLVVSLASANHEMRAKLMPVETKYPLDELIPLLREYNRVTRERIIFAWPMISGVNVREEDVRELANLTAGLPIKVDLIDVNDPSGIYLPPTPVELSSFRGNLKNILNMPFARRYSGGFDIRAACGMLARAQGEIR
jgi:23S rRNA (adenine2503-C2)-methyltransferase